MAYTTALDRNTILTADSYKKLTSPFVTNDGRRNPYGPGWSTQQIGDKEAHWQYGYGDSYAALIIRIPKDKRTFILLSNSVSASEPFMLGFGNLLNSPFAIAFFTHAVFGHGKLFSYDEVVNAKTPDSGQLFYERIFSQALLHYYAEQNYSEHTGKAQKLMYYLAEHDPARFQRMDGTTIYLLEKLRDQSLNKQMESAIKAYAATGYFHPEIHDSIGHWYDSAGNDEAARFWYHALADSTWYNEFLLPSL